MQCYSMELTHPVAGRNMYKSSGKQGLVTKASLRMTNFLYILASSSMFSINAKFSFMQNHILYVYFDMIEKNLSLIPQPFVLLLSFLASHTAMLECYNTL